jgi:3',5'-cyclic AMP phosphodiesterase CpdA
MLAAPTTISIAHLSDPHLTTPRPAGPRALAGKRLLSYLSWRQKRRFRHRPEILEEVVADMRAARPDHVLVTGDLTHVGLPDECAEAEGWLRRLGPADTISVIPGNHDRLIDDDWSSTAGRWEAWFTSDDCAWKGARGSGCFPSVRRRGHVMLIGLNSAVPTRPFFASGRVDREQRDALARVLASAAAAGFFRLVFVHHSPLPDGHAWRKRLADAKSLFAILSNAGVELAVHGHGHEEDFREIDTPSGPMLVAGAPSASQTGPNPAGWNCYRITRLPGAWQVRVERRRRNGADFESRVTEHVLRRRWLDPAAV